MASTISFVGERLADAESITNWGLTQQDGGGGGWGGGGALPLAMMFGNIARA